MHRCVAWSGIGSLRFDSDETGSAGFVLKGVCNFGKGKDEFRAGDHLVILCHSYGPFPMVLKKKLVCWSFEKVILAHRLPATLE